MKKTTGIKFFLKFISVFLISQSLNWLIPAFLYAGDLSLGFGYPYASVKYDFSKKAAAEMRYASASGINIFSARGYWDFAGYDYMAEFDRHRIKIFTGLEVGYIKFNTLDIKGNGAEIAGFIGGKYLITDKISLLMDFAPTFIYLKDADYGNVKVSGIEYVVNLGFYYCFGKSE